MPVPLLIDTGADRTVFNYLFFEVLRGDAQAARSHLCGLGGLAECACLQLQIRLTTVDRTRVIFRGEFAAAIDERSLDISVLGRDILSLFATIIDHPKRTVCLLSQSHDYRIVAQ